MLYSEFKSQFHENESEFEGEYKVEDTRNFPQKSVKIEDKIQVQPKRKKRKAVKTIFVVLLILIILASGTLLYFELFTDNGIYTVFSQISPQTDYYYCVSSGRFSTLDEAKPNSDDAKGKGAGGYIYYDGGYNVLLALYLDEKTAKEVAEKHGYSLVRIFKSSALKGLPPSLSGEYDKCKNFESELIRGLYEASVSMENNLDKATAQNQVSNALSKARSCTADFLKEGENSKLLAVQKYSSKIKQVLSECEKLEEKLTLSALRQTMIFIAIVMA